MSLKLKLITFCVAIGLIPLIVVGTLSVNMASNALSAQAFGQLESVRDAKKKNLQDLVNKWFHEVKLFSNVKEVYNAVGLIGEYALEYEIPGQPLDITSDEYKEVHQYAATPFIPFVKTLGYDDAILINDYGRVLLSIKKEKDLGADLKKGQYKNTNLARAFEKAVKGEIVFADFEPYAPMGSSDCFYLRPGSLSCWRYSGRSCFTNTAQGNKFNHDPAYRHGRNRRIISCRAGFPDAF